MVASTTLRPLPPYATPPPSPQVPVHHEFKKAYFVALRRAWFVFDPVALAQVEAALKADGLTEEEIEAKK